MIISPALNRACEAADITVAELREQYKGRKVVPKRFLVYHHLLIVERVMHPRLIPMSQPVCGKLCHRDHATILYGARKHSAWHYGTGMKSKTEEMVSAFRAYLERTGALLCDQWIEGYGEFQIPQGAVEIAEDAA